MKAPADLGFILFLVLIPVVMTVVPPITIQYMPDKWWVEIEKFSVTSGYEGDHVLHFNRTMPRTLVGYWHGEVDPPGCEFSGGPTIYSTGESRYKRFDLAKLINGCKLDDTSHHTFALCQTFPAFYFWKKTICKETDFLHYPKRNSKWSLPKTPLKLSPLERKSPFPKPWPLLLPNAVPTTE